MIPLRDKNPSYSVPVVNYILIAANAAVFFYDLSLGPQIDKFLIGEPSCHSDAISAYF